MNGDKKIIYTNDIKKPNVSKTLASRFFVSENRLKLFLWRNNAFNTLQFLLIV